MDYDTDETAFSLEELVGDRAFLLGFVVPIILLGAALVTAASTRRHISRLDLATGVLGMFVYSGGTIIVFTMMHTAVRWLFTIEMPVSKQSIWSVSLALVRCFWPCTDRGY